MMSSKGWICHRFPPAMRYVACQRTWTPMLTTLQPLVEGLDADGDRDFQEIKRPIRYISVGNEPFWQWYGEPPATITTPVELKAWRDLHLPEVWRSYGEFLRVTYTAIKEASPEVTVICGDLVGLNKGVEEQQLVFEEYTDYFDAIDIHFYGDHSSLEPLLPNLDPLLATGKPVWVLELGGPMDSYTQELHSEEVVSLQSMLFGYGVSRIFWSSLVPTINWPEPFVRVALLDRSFNKKPAYYTEALLVEKLDRFTHRNPRLANSQSVRVWIHRQTSSFCALGSFRCYRYEPLRGELQGYR